MAGSADDSCCPRLADVLDEESAEQLAVTLKAVADPARLRLLHLIGTAEGGWACACDLATPLGRSQPTVSHHLSVLVAAGLLEREQRGKWAWFRARRAQLADLGGALCLPEPA